MDEDPESGGSTPAALHRGLVVRVYVDRPAAKVALSGYLDLETAPILRAELAPLLAEPTLSEIDVDAAELAFCDASGLSPLLKALLELRRRGGTVRLARVQPAVRRLLEALHLEGDFCL
ncbi:MAG: STAS domain-containing protein [Mycobacteriales bacterium]